MGLLWSRLVRVLSALLISDIHFRRNERLAAPDRDIEVRNGLLRFLPELSDRLSDISLVLVCGDVAYEAVEHEYALAKKFLREIQAGLCDPRVLVIPGNHDVDRDVANTADQRMLRSSLRSTVLTDDDRDTKLEELLNDPDSGRALFDPLAAYNRFAADYGCAVSVVDPGPYWTVSIRVSDGYRVQVRGLTSVLISDSHDNDADDRLLLGEFQTADLQNGEPGVIGITLCHHPYSWLFDGCRQKMKLRHRSALHITGHEHDHDIITGREHDHDTSRHGAAEGIHLCAGALQPRRDPTWVPRLYGLSLDVKETDDDCSGSVVIVSAVWDRGADGFVIDVDQTVQIPVMRAEQGPAVETVEREVVRLTERVGALQSGDRLSVAKEINMDLGELTAGPSFEIPRRLVNHAQERNLMAKLWELTERRHGHPSCSNPFQESQ